MSYSPDLKDEIKMMFDRFNPVVRQLFPVESDTLWHLSREVYASRHELTMSIFRDSLDVSENGYEMVARLFPCVLLFLPPIGPLEMMSLANDDFVRYLDRFDNPESLTPSDSEIVSWS